MVFVKNDLSIIWYSYSDESESVILQYQDEVVVFDIIHGSSILISPSLFPRIMRPKISLTPQVNIFSAQLLFYYYWAA